MAARPSRSGLSFADRHELWSAEQRRAAVSVEREIRRRKLETVRFAFCDQHGVLRGKTLVADEALKALRNGVTMTTTLLAKDTSHRTAFAVFTAGGGMGVDEMAVVDPELRVRGLNGLRVCDSSVMPRLVSSNTNAPTLMIGERAADLIRDPATRPVAPAKELQAAREQIFTPVEAEARKRGFTINITPMGIATIPQAALAIYGRGFVRDYFKIPEDRLLVCGISFGYADDSHPANQFRTSRARIEEAATFHDE